MTHKLIPDLAMAEAFLSRLAPEGEITFQTFDDDKNRKNHGLAKVFHGTLAQFSTDLSKLQTSGAGVFVMVNRGDGITHEGKKTCRTTANVKEIRALFADLDGAPLEPVLNTLQPDIVVESSQARFHAYWQTRDCPLGEFSQLQKQIAEKFGSDPSVNDLPRVMRLPGFWHLKNEPFMTRIIFPE
jgi:hypothetical protein